MLSKSLMTLSFEMPFLVRQFELKNMTAVEVAAAVAVALTPEGRVLVEAEAVAEVEAEARAKANLLKLSLQSAQDLVQGLCLLSLVLGQKDVLSQDLHQGPDHQHQLVQNN